MPPALDQFKVGRDIRLDGQLRNGVFWGKPGTMITRARTRPRRASAWLAGRAGLVLCLGLSAYAVVVGGWAVATKRRRLAVSAQNALVAAFGCVLVATAVLATALLTRDVRLRRWLTSDELPVGYTLSAFWGGQEGSLLLWLFVLTGHSAVRLLRPRRRQDLLRG